MKTTRVRVGLAGLVVAAAMAAPALASAPPGYGMPEWIGICSGGPSDGSSCSHHGNCPDGKCKARLLKGKGTAINATLTAIVDDDVGDMAGNPSRYDAPLPSRAAAILLEFRYKGQYYALSEIYQAETEPWDPPAVSGYSFLAESFLDMNSPAGFADIGEICRNRSFDLNNDPGAWALGGAHPLGPSLAKRLRTILGFSENAPGIPVVMSAKPRGKANPIYDGSDELASMIRCRVRISFAAYPLPEQAKVPLGGYGPCPSFQDSACTFASGATSVPRKCLSTLYFVDGGSTFPSMCTRECTFAWECGSRDCVANPNSSEVGFCRQNCTLDSDCSGYNQVCAGNVCWWRQP
ncbi:MAG: hypothetical protein ABGY42_13835 [bacterium]